MDIKDFLKNGGIWQRMPQYQNKKTKAIEICRQELKKHKNPYVAISGGKDSVLTAYFVNEAARSENRDFILWCHVSDASFPGTEETVEAVATELNRELVFYRSPISAFEAVKLEQKQDFGKGGYFFDSVREFAQDKDLAFVGTRAFESKRRMQAAKVHGMVFHSKAMGDVTVCNPLTWFRLEDVAAGIVEYGAPMHPIYFKYDVEQSKNQLGEERWIRLGYTTAKDLMHKGTIVFLKHNYPGIYNKLVQAFPECGAYI